ncbi:hypothetical protein J6590_024378, partial [Homalodisca vitripennis]
TNNVILLSDATSTYSVFAFDMSTDIYLREYVITYNSEKYEASNDYEPPRATTEVPSSERQVVSAR